MESSLTLRHFVMSFLLIAGGLPLAHAGGSKTIAPQPAPACVAASFSASGSPSWSTVSLTITNRCTVSVDFQNSAITFQNASALSTAYWFQSNALSYPVGPTQMTSQPATGGGYTATVPLQFPAQSWAITKLQPGQSFTVLYGVSTPSYVASSVKVWLGSAVLTGELDLSNASAQPAGVSATSAVVDILQGGQLISKAMLPWQGTQAVTGLAAGSYALQPESVTDTQGNVYQGIAVPATVSVQAGSAVSAAVSYAPVTTPGSVQVRTPALPAVLSGYTGAPVVTLTRSDTGGSSLVRTLPWNTTTAVSGLVNNVTYTFSSPIISWNANRCTAGFTPASVVSSASSPPLATLAYTCVPVQQDKITLLVSGLPSTVTTVSLTLIPSDGSGTVVQPVSLSGGSGSATVSLADGVIYNVTASSVPGYTASFTPQPLIATAGGKETVVFAPQTSGRIITYIPGWKTPPLATNLAAAGYTNAIIAFGVFSTTQPGQIVPAFDTVTKTYIASLKQAGIKVSLSLGGASTSIAGTSINFHDVVSKAGSSSAFQQTFVTSVKSLVTQYGFDGIDIDIESGLTASGTFSQPVGDIALLAAILNQLHADNPALLISLAPQTANISATSGFDATWGNYASLIMQTYQSLSWVGIQIYNAGCTFGIDHVCYDPNKTTSPDASVANAVDLLASWPSTSPSGGATGFQRYISYLQPSQVVLGYLVANSSGTGDGSPVIPVNTIKRSIQCLTSGTKAANSCDNYIPPKTYAGFGGVFNWEVTYDQSNGYAFAKGLTACVRQGNCQ